MPPPLEGLERQRRLMSWLGGLLLMAMSAALALLTWSDDGQGARLDFEARWSTLAGLCGLVLIFVLYTQKRERDFAALEARLRDGMLRETALQARMSELSFLFDTSTQLQLRLDLQGMLDLAVQRLASCFDAHQASIMLHDPAQGLLTVRAAAGMDTILVADGVSRPDEGIAGHVFATGETLLLGPDEMRERFPHEVKGGRNIASSVCALMRFQENRIGVVSVSRSGASEPFSESHTRMLEAFAEHCAAAVVRIHHHRSLLQTVIKVA